MKVIFLRRLLGIAMILDGISQLVIAKKFGLTLMTARAIAKENGKSRMRYVSDDWGEK